MNLNIDISHGTYRLTAVRLLASHLPLSEGSYKQEEEELRLLAMFHLRSSQEHLSSSWGHMEVAAKSGTTLGSF